MDEDRIPFDSYIYSRKWLGRKDRLENISGVVDQAYREDQDEELSWPRGTL